MICDRCKGNGKVIVYKHHLLYMTETCFLCDGTGEEDWVSKIFCKNQSIINFENDYNKENNWWFENWPFEKLKYINWCYIDSKSKDLVDMRKL